MRTALVAILILGPGLSFAQAGSPAQDTLAEAWQDLEKLEDLLDTRDASNDEIGTYIEIVLEASLSQAPWRAQDVEEPWTAAARRHWARSIAKYRAETLDMLLEALVETEFDRHGVNRRRPVNVIAGRALARTRGFLDEDADRRRLSRRIIRKIKRLERARHEVSPDVFEGAFRALARIGDVQSLTWMMENYLHARKQPEEVARLRAALRAMHEFPQVPGSVRYALVDEILKRYLAMEALAGQSTNDVVALAARRFWDSVQTDVIPLVQKASGYPRDKQGIALATLQAISDWFKENDNPRDDAWTVPWT